MFKNRTSQEYNGKNSWRAVFYFQAKFGMGITMEQSTIRFPSFPRTEPPKDFVFSVVEVFRKYEEKII
ncbi:hypothetical protein P4T20_15270 [Aneurinibacillus thermoaerophilus]|uniref:hypothetical protein n=1 Tax=Aneurinibacillus thermoaerophilus TaxID=143495 RepID=UPI002E1DF39B|nr:hypothetical protein [Aneurinibacillus thermoaerophilus]